LLYGGHGISSYHVLSIYDLPISLIVALSQFWFFEITDFDVCYDC
jgi:hypothetical protein